MIQSRARPLLALASLALLACGGAPTTPAGSLPAVHVADPISTSPLEPPPGEGTQARLLYPYNLPQYNDLSGELAKANEGTANAAHQ